LRQSGMNDGQQRQPDEKTLEFGFHKNLDCLICMRLCSDSAPFTPRPMEIQVESSIICLAKR
jgi:hypothetical protein